MALGIVSLCGDAWGAEETATPDAYITESGVFDTEATSGATITEDGGALFFEFVAEPEAEAVMGSRARLRRQQYWVEAVFDRNGRLVNFVTNSPFA